MQYLNHPISHRLPYEKFMGSRIWVSEQHVLKGACKKQLILKKAFEEQMSVQLQVALANCSSDEEMVVEPTQMKVTDEDMSTFVAKLKESNLNWFHLYEQFENEGKMLAEELSDYMNEAYQKLSLVLPENEMKQVEISKAAFDVDQSSSRETPGM